MLENYQTISTKNITSNDDTIVTVVCFTYNHEKYLHSALESFATQITSFKYEVIVHDDASTDKTSAIINEYKKKYPKIFIPIYQKENQYQTNGVEAIYKYILPLVKGKYVAFCEGDDYWCDLYKLQLQYEIMESNSEISFCTHRVKVVKEDGTPSDAEYPQEEAGLSCDVILTGTQCVEIMFDKKCEFQTSSYFIRKDVLLKEERMLLGDILNGDNAIFFTAILSGSIYYAHKIMSCYRSNSADGWNEQHRLASADRRIKYMLRYCEGLLLLIKLSDETYKDQVIPRVYELLFYLVVRHGQYKVLKNKLLQSAYVYKPKRENINTAYICRCLLIYMPWLCRLFGVVFRLYRRFHIKKVK